MGKVLAVASGGGHWKQLMKLSDAFDSSNVIYVTTMNGLAEESGLTNSYLLPDASRSEKFKLIWLFVSVFWMVIRIRPKFVVSTGAAPGLLAIMCGRLVGAKTLWIDSIANGDELSMCGRLSKYVAHKTLTQWPKLSDGDRITYHGSVL